MATELDDAMIVDFPLRGEWLGFNSPSLRANVLGIPRRADRIRHPE